MNALVAFAGVDVRNVRRDPLLSVVVASPLLLALTLRVAYPAARQWAATTHHVDLDPHRALLLGFLVVLHSAFIFGMLGALLILDDTDDRTLLALRVTPVTLEGYLGYRAAAVAALSMLGLALAVPLSGLSTGLPLAMLPGLLLTAACAPIVTGVTVAMATNKIEGVAIIKLLGVPTYLPLATWFTDAPWTWALAVIPTFWPVRVLWAGLDDRVDVTALTVGTAYAIALLVGLRRRILNRA
jgi:fluoroquinolone transport system permease protein